MTEVTEVQRSWAPNGLRGRDPSGLSYVVVDEIEGGAVGLAVSEWPRVDAEGRLRFRSPPLLLGADRASLERFLGEHRSPRELAERPLRVGDVFAVQARPERLQQAEEVEARLEPVLAPEEWIVPPVYDVTPDARDAAKAAFYGAVVPTLDPAQVAQLGDLVQQPPPPPAAPPPPPPRPGWLRSHLLQIVGGVVLLGAGLGAGIALGGQNGGGTENVTSTSFVTSTDLATSTDFTTSTDVTTSTEFTTSTDVTTSTVFTTSTIFTTVQVPPPPPPVG